MNSQAVLNFGQKIETKSTPIDIERQIERDRGIDIEVKTRNGCYNLVLRATNFEDLVLLEHLETSCQFVERRSNRSFLTVVKEVLDYETSRPFKSEICSLPASIPAPKSGNLCFIFETCHKKKPITKNKKRHLEKDKYAN